MVSLNLSDNQITAIKNLDSLDKMETLKLNNNQITTIRGVKNLDTLKYLGISKCNLTKKTIPSMTSENYFLSN